MADTASLGVVVIGRNEGERLARCLESVRHAGCPVVYVDSGSSDDSLRVAALLGADIVELDPAHGFSAARARNEGFKRLLERDPGIRFVQFLDGDCTLLPGWIEAGLRALADDAGRAAVFGLVLERDAQASVYNRLCDIEWRCAPGDLADCGGLGGRSMMRAAVFRELGGFRPEVIAGEDSELGVRMGLAGHKVTSIACPMATHDAGMHRFGQWWRRAVRAGHAIGQRSDLHGRSAARDCVHERASTFFWGIVLPLGIVLSAFATQGASLLLLAAYPLLGIRVWRHRRAAGDGPGDAALYAAFVLIGKFANAAGLLKFFVNKSAGRYPLIEYK
jgi:GT2 family glycosyltransferase